MFPTICLNYTDTYSNNFATLYFKGKKPFYRFETGCIELRSIMQRNYAPPQKKRWQSQLQLPCGAGFLTNLWVPANIQEQPPAIGVLLTGSLFYPNAKDGVRHNRGAGGQHHSALASLRQRQFRLIGHVGSATMVRRLGQGIHASSSSELVYSTAVYTGCAYLFSMTPSY